LLTVYFVMLCYNGRLWKKFSHRKLFNRPLNWFCPGLVDNLSTLFYGKHANFSFKEQVSFKLVITKQNNSI